MIFNRFNKLENKATEHYHSIINLYEIHNYMEYLVKLKVNGFDIKSQDNVLILGYESDEHLVVVDTLVPYFYDLMYKLYEKREPSKGRFGRLVEDDNIQVDDIFYQIYGDNNTICDFYKVVSITGNKYKKVKIRKLTRNIISVDDVTKNILVEPGDIIENSMKLNLVKFYDNFKILKHDFYKGDLIKDINFDTILKKYNNNPKSMNYTNRINKRID